MFASRVGTPLTSENVARSFRITTQKAGVGINWTPRELRHTFVTVLSANGVPVESIALLAGHDRTATTELVYRHEIRLAVTQGAEMSLGFVVYWSRIGQAEPAGPVDAPQHR